MRIQAHTGDAHTGDAQAHTGDAQAHTGDAHTGTYRQCACKHRDCIAARPLDVSVACQSSSCSLHQGCGWYGNAFCLVHVRVPPLPLPHTQHTLRVAPLLSLQVVAESSASPQGCATHMCVWFPFSCRPPSSGSCQACATCSATGPPPIHCRCQALAAMRHTGEPSRAACFKARGSDSLCLASIGGTSSDLCPGWGCARKLGAGRHCLACHGFPP